MFAEDNATETLPVRISRGGNLPPIRLINLYRPPTVGADLRSKVFEVTALPSGDGVIIAGDFNVHHGSWSRRNPDANGSRLFEWMMNQDMFSWNDPSVSTRTAIHSSPDIVLSSLEFNAGSWRVLPAWGSDHRPVYFEVPSHLAPSTAATAARRVQEAA